ncbi:type I-E CRISPR-associated protein Cse2/CasB [Streptomyces sp. DT171]|uniref:type I-E CRISPR-associated protein Cse2/CasB n=1 Tax=Streptomyces sp. DT171 TaxID=3416524 RepID=UPI003CF4D165
MTTPPTPTTGATGRPAHGVSDASETTGTDLQEGRPQESEDRGPSLRHQQGPAGQAASRYISQLQGSYLRDESAAVATLARLRRGAGHTVHTLVDHWGIGGLDELAEALEERADDQPFVHRERAEEAVYLAVTLWSLHQQSGRDEKMHIPGATLGRAVRVLMQLKSGDSPPAQGAEGGTRPWFADPTRPFKVDDEMNEPLRKRFVRVGAANSIESVAVRLREIVTLLRTARVPLDYGRLADQLYRWQFPDRRASVRREWGREFHLAAWVVKKGDERNDGGSERGGDGSGE